ncbi:uncharacterized protein FSUBG_2862 [Fusarium subglutinans]|uniref:Transcription factor domain-containing protein n=1 Tax=Gibberella subglutinans TaxID=42677 RepID=A0A8H5Q7K0_GIBSU|nr:uncharacterized protein FSUBG_2862 [Fusarium subglutinans]KAF5610601.1 hypothetical protein FSUBG_2862 [Fusarium subglutinans]
MATERTNQETRSTAGDQSDHSSENESKQMTRNSQNNTIDRFNAGSQGDINQPQGQQPVQSANQETGKKSSAPRVRLDMDLDVELQLKAKIQGDLELAIFRATNSLESEALPERNLGDASVDQSESTSAFSPLKQLDLMLSFQMKLKYRSLPSQNQPPPVRAPRMTPVTCMRFDTQVPKLDELLMLFSIFAGAALAWTDELLNRLEATKANAVSAFDCYLHSALSIIEDAEIPLLPSVTAVSAICTLAHVAINSDDIVPIKALGLRSRCYNMCREMMIHRLDSPAAQKEREISPASNIDLEVQRRIWWNMVASDWLTSFSGSSQEGIYTFIPRLMRVKQPRNVDDAELTISGDIPNLSISVPTDMTFFFLRLRTAEISREIIDAIAPLADDAPEEDYRVILQLDRKLQDFVDGLPVFCKADPESMHKSKEICELRPFIYWQRISLHLGIHARICRLHRPYHLAAYSNPRYSYSRTTILASAYKILELRRMMDDPVAKLHFRPERYWVIFLHVTSAAVALAVDLSHDPDAPDAEAIKEKVKGAYETLNKSRKNAESLIRGIEKNMEQVMGTLQKQRANAMTSASPAGTSSANLDSVPESAFTDVNDITVGMQEDSFGDEHSHQLWSDFLAAVPDLEEFQWTSLLQDLDFDPSNFS